VKLVRFHHDGPRAGVVEQDKVLELPAADGFASWLTPEGRRRAQELAARGALPLHAIAQLEFLPPVAEGARIFCIGINYKSHAGETGRDLPPQPSVFIRTSESVVGHGQPLAMPHASTHYDYEGELAILIGKRGRDIAQEDAMDHIAGYTAFNDGSVRDYQKHSVTAGKNFDASGACGPWVVMADELGDPGALQLATRLNGNEVQSSGTDLLIYSVPVIVSYLSRITALRVGDVIATGTPAGVGARRDPPLWMKAGDTVEVDISGIGVLRNHVASTLTDL
jgi:2-keto-4-pentenoate hydratase/2-oxohepta-3-ene-1,7-dioic acid hydratase in catechol pathway